MTSPHGIDKDHGEKLERLVLEELNGESVVKALKKQLDEYCQAALDRTTQYMQDEYVLVLHDIVRDRSKRMVQELLNGNHEVARFLALEARETHYGPDQGKPIVYDPDGIRAAIVERFKSEIASAEMIALQEENARLRESVRFYREIRNR